MSKLDAFFLAAITAFIGYFMIGGIISIFYPPFFEAVLYGATGCALGTGTANALLWRIF